jgi:carbonic anhydrase
MRLLEAIMEGNQQATSSRPAPGLHLEEFATSLPLAALTCIDPRLNHLIPEVLGVPEEQFIWLRNAGNVLTGPLSSTMRSLALACAVKGGKEIAVIGHTDCLVCKTTMLALTDAFGRLGIERTKLPENLIEYFGLSASERQNVIRGADLVRQSPLIGSGIPVHGLLVDLQSGRLEWLVNGYQTLGAAKTSMAAALKQTAADSIRQTAAEAMNLLGAKLSDFKIGEVKLPEFKIGGATVDPNQWLSQARTPASPAAGKPTARESTGTPALEWERKLDRNRKFKIIGSDQKVYGPIDGSRILEWIAEGRIDWKTASQMEGSGEWKPLSGWAETPAPPPVPVQIPARLWPNLPKSRKR